MEFIAIDPGNVRWDKLDAFPDRIFSQRRGWLEFVAGMADGKIIIAELKRGSKTVGYFTGVMFQRMGVPILGSPFKGWMTSYMGFNLVPDTSRREALIALRRFAFQELGCLHLEVRDRHFTAEDLEGLDADITLESTYITRLDRDEAEIFSGMKSACRRCIRKAEKNGLTIEEATPEGFAEEYHGQLIDVFAKQDLRPPYSKRYVQRLIEHIHPSGDMLLLRARTKERQKIASAIYFGHKEHSIFWGNGSLRNYQILRPNEALHWYALRYWKNRGIKFHDWCGPDEYKLKYGPHYYQLPRVCMSRFRALKWGRDAAYHLYTLPRAIKRRRHLMRIKSDRGCRQSSHMMQPSLTDEHPDNRNL